MALCPCNLSVDAKKDPEHERPGPQKPGDRAFHQCAFHQCTEFGTLPGAFLLHDGQALALGLSLSPNL